jgi:uncharacterized damage-inducible protein DinB
MHEQGETNMKYVLSCALGLGLLLGCATQSALANGTQAAQAAAPSAQAEDKTPPSYDMKAQAAVDLQQLQQKFVDLAGAIPQDKYAWRPEPGVRSIAELFLHISAANYNIPHMLGAPLPAGFDGKTFEKSTTDKTQIVAALNKSFGIAIAGVQGMTNADFAKLEPKLGPQANDGDVIYILVTHAHEHLGQAIAYARANGVIPPWTAAAEKKNPQAPKE